LSLFECIKNPADCFGFNADPGVDKTYFDLVRRGIKSFDADAPFLRGEFDAVLDEVPKNLLQACGITFHVRANRAKFKVYLQILCLDLVAANLIRALEDLMDRNRFEA
jgi:hypothetical protein